ncbi:MAG: DUF309 domain-containing protein [Maritimibacter sp.]
MNAAPHIPGQTPRPAHGSIRPGLLEGLALYRSGFFWEAHEAWEPLWLEATPNSRDRSFLQGIIQLANGRLKLLMGKPQAAQRIAVLAREHLERAGGDRLLDQDPVWAMTELTLLESGIRENLHNNADFRPKPRTSVEKLD